jgi:hypothetical protein
MYQLTCKRDGRAGVFDYQIYVGNSYLMVARQWCYQGIPQLFELITRRPNNGDPIILDLTFQDPVNDKSWMQFMIKLVDTSNLMHAGFIRTIDNMDQCRVFISRSLISELDSLAQSHEDQVLHFWIREHLPTMGELLNKQENENADISPLS